MDKLKLLKILENVSEHNLTVQEALAALKTWPSEELDYAHLDHHRKLRTGIPEVIYGESKTAEQIAGIMNRMVLQENVVLVTRIYPDKAEEVGKLINGTIYYKEARILSANEHHIPVNAGRGEIMVVCAGTSDIPIAEEAFVTASFLGHAVNKKYDIGVAGIHRLFSCLGDLQKASVVIVVAGMEGALPSVVAGMIESPVIAVPSSVGYGVGKGGYAALLGMLNSCAPGVAVVNIDNGFGAACMAAAINKK